MTYPIVQLAAIVEGSLLNRPVHEAIIEHVLLDSRQVMFPASAVFIALQGRRHDGHEFIADLYRQGVRHFVVSKNLDPSPFTGANFILVENTGQAFHRLAAFHRRQFSLPVIGITGSNGKTIVKEWLFQLLQQDYHIVRSPKSFNSQTGVPLSVLQITKEHNLGIFEAGISQMGEMEKLAPILSPGIGIFTNIGEAHSEGFPNLETKLRQKLLLFQDAHTIIYCRDDDRVDRAMQALPGKQFFTWSKSGKQANLEIASLQPSAGGMLLQADYCPTVAAMPPVRATFIIPYSDAASVENALHCIALMLYLGYPPETIASRLPKLEPVAMRLELKEGINHCIVINDSYNSDLTSLTIALNFLEQQGKKPRRTVILSDILQSGQPPEQLYGTVARLLLEKRIDRLFGIGQEIFILKKLLPASFESAFFPHTTAFLDNFQRIIFREETILLKGARRFEFERIANRLAEKVHATTLEINLGALLHNLRTYQSYLRPGVKLMVMVKAGAYGSGSVEVAKLLEFQHLDFLGVAYADEGVELRRAGIQLPIIVMNPEEATFEALVRYQLEPEIYSLSLLAKLAAFLKEENAGASIHLKLDTGMHRLGFTEEDLDHLLSGLEQVHSRMDVRSVFTHLAASEASTHDEFTHQQVALFQRMYDRIARGLGYRPLRHVLNSSGIVRFPEYQMDMVRLGIGLYGIDSSGLMQERLQTVLSLKATISQIKQLSPGETVGYGRSSKAEKPLRIATISLGYADGLLRSAGNGRFAVLIHGKRAPVVGKVCMDMTMVDVTDIPQAEEGDPVVIFGKDLPVQELAQCLDTIPYEVFTNISGRVKRVYVQE